MKRLSMRKIREVLRLNAQGMSTRKIAPMLGISHPTIQAYLRRSLSAGLSWPLPADLSDTDLEQRLYPRQPSTAAGSFAKPDCPYIHKELRRKGVTLSLLWEEYRQGHSSGYSYSQFCVHYRCWKGHLSPVMRQCHVAGERLFVDYSGMTLDIACPQTGEVRSAQLFVATLGASNYTFAEATWTQQLPDWIASHVRAFEFFGGVTAQVVLDNLRSGVTKACFYEPTVNRTYSDMIAHYDTAAVPARPYKPRDKAKVEGAVLIAQRWIAARLRNQTFFSLDELNAAIRPLLEQMNAKVTRHLGASRRTLFEQLDQPALKPLPVVPYVYADWKECRAGLDYHIDVYHHYYSVPYQLLRQKLWARITSRTIEVYFKGKRVAAHVRSSSNYQHTTCKNHMPSHHRAYADWTPERLRRQASRLGPNAGTLIEVILQNRRHPEQGFRASMGIMRLTKQYGNERLEAACGRALEINAHSYSSVKSILKNNLERKHRKPATDGPAIIHPNIRGADYFH